MNTSNLRPWKFSYPVPVLGVVQRIDANADAVGGSPRIAAAIEDHPFTANRGDGIRGTHGAKETENRVDSVGRLLVADQKRIRNAEVS